MPPRLVDARLQAVERTSNGAVRWPTGCGCTLGATVLRVHEAAHGSGATAHDTALWVHGVATALWLALWVHVAMGKHMGPQRLLLWT